MRVPTVLVTGFEPFGGSTLNPSQVVVEAIDSAVITAENATLHTALLPVSSCRIHAVVESLWNQAEPDIVLHLGESAKADRLTLERVALNLLDFDSPDNAGLLIENQPIDPVGPAAQFVTAPVHELRGRLKGEGIEVEMSLSAGAYLCNQTLYQSLSLAQQRGGRPVGFVHVPSLPEQVQRGERNKPDMPREQLIEQIRCLITLWIDLERARQK